MNLQFLGKTATLLGENPIVTRVFETIKLLIGVKSSA